MSDSVNPGDDAEAPLDPRFDPAFQRGFAGTVTTGRRRPLAGAPVAPPSRVERVLVPDTPQTALVAHGLAADVPAEEGPAEAEGPAEDREQRVNGFIVALIVIGIALIVSSVGLARVGLSIVGGQSEQIDTATLFLGQFAYTSAPYATVLGVGTLIGVLFYFAIRRDRLR